VCVEQLLPGGAALHAGRELRAVPAAEPRGGGRGAVELGRLEVPAAGDAVDVLVLVTSVRVRAPLVCERLALALGELLLAFHGAGR
jgi:hypothetical protein